MDIKKALAHLKKDQKLAPYIEKTVLKEHFPSFDVYEGLLSSIASQQLSVKAAATIYKRFTYLFEDGYPHAYKLLEMDVPTLRSVGLSNSKAKYMGNVAEYFRDNNLFEKDWHLLGNDEIISELTKIKGVGIWTVQMILMFNLNRQDIFPTGDLGIQQAITQIYDLQSEKNQLRKDMIRISQSWIPYRTLACRYLWTIKDSV